MSRITIIGAHGAVAQRILSRLYDRGDEAVGVIRNPEHGEDILRLGGETAVLDIESATIDQLASVLTGSDAVVFAAGGGPNSGAARKRTVDYAGSVLTADAATAAGVRRMVQISAIGVDEPLAEDADPGWAAYVDAKRDADAYLKGTDLDWTILRPGGLTSDDGTGSVQLGIEVERASIPRDDVAELVLAVLDDPTSIGRVWEVVSGSTPIADAVAAAGSATS
ncbi:SDR family oxidoreductase [Naasia lichenicola]|uniref:SDR family oxidoreductase n=1 Tax=Naasia lichenicola TaxID=2565933 RepID=A0A4S4FF50_9MICO|nr:SDR family oxidoreductase [Naasia lichenicola]THG28608.1 SDR family oxidoreductase [Naasia lichenicola]